MKTVEDKFSIEFPESVNMVDLAFSPVNPDSPMLATDLVAIPSAEDNIFTVTPTSLDTVTGNEPVPVYEESFDITVKPAENTDAVLEEIVIDTDATVQATTDTGSTVLVGIVYFYQ